MTAAYNKGLTTFADNVAEIADIVLEKLPQKPIYVSIFSDWEAVVGAELASKSAPYKVITQGEKKILVLKSKKGCSIELQHDYPRILEKTHKFLGKQVFSSIKIIQMDINDAF